MIEQVGVVGSGTMGNGIAHVFAQNGFNVVLVDLDQERLDRAIATISKNLDRQISKDRITEEDKKTTLGSINTSLSLKDLSKCQLVVEAASENPEIKYKIFEDLERHCSDDAILASNTSSISIDRIAEKVSDPSRVIGMHFFNPVPVMKLVEIVKGAKTSDAVSQFIFELSTKLGKTPVLVNDSPGFVSNRVLMPMINEAIFCLSEGVAKAEDIDTVMQLGMAHPMGPLRLADLIGLDVCLYIMDVLYQDFQNDKYQPCPLLKEMVENGQLGRKSGKGFFDYS